MYQVCQHLALHAYFRQSSSIRVHQRRPSGNLALYLSRPNNADSFEGAIYTWIAGWICEGLVVASLAEMASMAPTSAGQYHWCVNDPIAAAEKC